MQILAGIVSSENIINGGRKMENLLQGGLEVKGEKKAHFKLVWVGCQQIFYLLVDFNLKNTFIFGDKTNDAVLCYS